MTDSKIYKVLKQVDKGTFKFKKLVRVSEKLTDMGLIAPVINNNQVKGYNLTIQGKIFIWDNENWKL